jgi:hypothetical protein
MRIRSPYFFGLLIVFGFTPARLPAQVQYPPQPDQFIQAKITGGAGSGKCTFEVYIDGAADVQIRGSEGRLRWVGGGPITWRRLECNQPLPRNPRNFRFRGIDGRGTQTLLKTPNENNGVAVIRVDDPQKGSEGYTGDIMWDGADNTTPDRDDWSNQGNDRNWDGSGNWSQGGNWSQRAVTRCQNSIRDQVSQRFGGNLWFSSSVNTDKAGSYIIVQGVASSNYRNGRTTYMQYSCVLRPNGDVVDAKNSPIGDRW